MFADMPILFPNKLQILKSNWSCWLLYKYNCYDSQLVGCFPGSAVVITPSGDKLMKDITMDDYILTGKNH